MYLSPGNKNHEGKGFIMKAVTGTQMRSLDRRTITESGIPGEILMERAGILAGKALEEWILHLRKEEGKEELFGDPGDGRRIVFLAGKGNNGGDAFAAAKFLHEQGYSVSLYCVEDLSLIRGDALAHFRKMPRFLQEMASFPIPEEVYSPDNILVDSLLGTGFSGSLKERYASVCRSINSSGAWIAAMDIPSGLSADTGQADADAVCAHMTLTMASPKKGMFSEQGIRLTGRLQVLDIGIDKTFYRELEETLECTSLEEARSFLKREQFDTHKNRRGHVYVFGGSILYSGAVLLCAEAALRSGAGLVSCFVPEGMGFFSSVPKALMVRVLPSGSGSLQEESLAEIDLEKASSLAVGPGMGTSAESIPFLKKILKAELPLVLDADGLNLLALYHAELFPLLSARQAPTVLTPHPGEMKRLLESLAPGKNFVSRQEQALFLAQKSHAFVVLKGARSLASAPDGRAAVNLSGSPALATAGSGDILCGILGALMADPVRDPFDSVRLGVFLHGLCGELASCSMTRSFIADDLILLIGKALRRIRQDA